MKKLIKILLKDFNYELNSFIIVKRLKPYRKYMFGLILIFFGASILYYLDISFVTELVLVVMFLLLFAIPLQLINSWTSNFYIVTEAFLIKHDTSWKYHVIDYDRVTNVVLKEERILSFKFGKKTYKIVFDKYDKDLKFLITVFEAKGFLKYDGEFLERPVEFEILDDQFKIIELDEIETPTQRLVGSLYDNYESVTPGYFKYIVFHNSIISEVAINDGNLSIKVNSVDVKVNHPENTTHEAIEAQDVIIVFEDVEAVECFQKPSNDRQTKNTLLSTEIEELPNVLLKAVISDSFVEDTDSQSIFRMISSQSTMTNTTLIKYKSIIVGWKSISGQAWFEKNESFGKK
ncbi:MAG: hypothetical protein QM489_03470 [Candidatus Izemoplasma sp.]